MSTSKALYIGVDFDGTVVHHAYPDVGAELGGCVDVLRELVAAGHQLILFTMRSGDGLDAAEEWFCKRGIPLYGVNRNPTQDRWTTSPKAYCHVYIDDAALGCPLLHDASRPYADWQRIRALLGQAMVLAPILDPR